jgi:hypothetical protein
MAKFSNLFNAAREYISERIGAIQENRHFDYPREDLRSAERERNLIELEIADVGKLTRLLRSIVVDVEAVRDKSQHGLVLSGADGRRVEWPNLVLLAEQAMKLLNHLDAPDVHPPRVLVTVSGGVADYIADPGVAVHVFDFDNWRAGDTDLVPDEFADLAKEMSAPVEPGIA